MSNDKFKGKWKEIKGEIITQWGKLTDDEVEKSAGNLISISGIIQQRYGEEKDKIEAKLASIASKFGNDLEDFKNKMKE